MKTLAHQGDGVAIASAAATLPFPPTSWAGTHNFGGPAGGYPAEVDVELWSDTTVAITAAELVAARPHPATIADDAIESANTGADSLTLTGHAYSSGDGPFALTGAALPGGLSTSGRYFVRVLTANTVSLHLTAADAMGGVRAVDITSSGTGTIVGAGAQRLRWHSVGLLGNAGDGAVALTASRAYAKRFPHAPRTAAYAIVGTPDAATSATVAAVTDN